MRKDGELEKLLSSHVGADDSLLARSLATHLGEGSPIFKLLSPTDAGGLRMQLTKTFEDALAEQRQHILREFSLDAEGSALSRLVSEFSLDVVDRARRLQPTYVEDADGRDAERADRRKSFLSCWSRRRGASSLSRLKRELLGTIEQLAKSNVEFHLPGHARRRPRSLPDARKREEAQTPRHGVEFEERLGALLAAQAQRLGDVHEATGETTGVIKLCKKGDHVIELGVESAAANARIVWEAKEKQSYSLRAALEEIAEARRNRAAQVGVFVFLAQGRAGGAGVPPRATASDIVVVWDAEEQASDVVVGAAYSLARALAVREQRTDEASQEVIAEIERAARGVERQTSLLEDVRRMAETVKSHGDKIADRSSRMIDELRRSVELLDAQLATLRRGAEATA